MPCKNICHEHRGSHGYRNGSRWCGACTIWIKWDGKFCPCCRAMLRIRPHKGVFKEHLRAPRMMRRKMKRPCVICNATFQVNDCNTRITCSTKCARVNKINKQKAWVAKHPHKVLEYARKHQENRRIHAARKEGKS